MKNEEKKTTEQTKETKEQEEKKVEETKEEKPSLMSKFLSGAKKAAPYVGAFALGAVTTIGYLMLTAGGADVEPPTYQLPMKDDSDSEGSDEQ